MLTACTNDSKSPKGNLKKTEADRCYHITGCYADIDVRCVRVCAVDIFASRKCSLRKCSGAN